MTEKLQTGEPVRNLYFDLNLRQFLIQQLSRCFGNWQTLIGQQGRNVAQQTLSIFRDNLKTAARGIMGYRVGRDVTP